MLDPCAKVGDVAELGIENTLQYDLDENRLRNAETFHAFNEEPEVTPEWGGQYLNAEMLLPRRDRMTRGQVICQKQDANGNPIGRPNKISILDICLYEVYFPGGKQQSWQLT